MIPQYYIPTKLGGLVDVIHEQKSTEPGKWKFLPDGKIELMFRIGQDGGMNLKNARFHGANDSPGHNFCFLAGFCTKPVEISFEKMHFISIQMNPLALKAIFGIPAYELKDFAIAGEHILPNLQEIEDKMNELPDFMSRAQWLELHVISKINESSELKSVLGILHLTDKLSKQNFQYPVNKINDLLGYSKTQSYRIFNDWFGMSAGKFQRMMQFTQSINSIHFSDESNNLTDLGLQLGYFDQAHFIRSFKEFAGITPGDYRKQKTHIPGQLIM